MSITKLSITKQLTNGDVLVVQHETDSGVDSATKMFKLACSQVGINDVKEAVNETEKAYREQFKAPDEPAVKTKAKKK